MNHKNDDFGFALLPKALFGKSRQLEKKTLTYNETISSASRYTSTLFSKPLAMLQYTY